MRRFNADAAATTDPLGVTADSSRVLAAALERALSGRQVLLLDAAAAPDAPALQEALRLSAAHIEGLLARLAALTPPARRPASHRAA